jgi:metaxin
MASTTSAPSASGWRKVQIPRPLQQLFDHFPLRTYDANRLPERSQHLTSADLPTLYVFSTDSDARMGLPSFNPGCLKWQACPPSPSAPLGSLSATPH